MIPSGRTPAANNKMNFYGDISDVDSQGLQGGNYSNAINLMKNQDDYRYNLLITPGLINANSTSAGSITSIQLNN